MTDLTNTAVIPAMAKLDLVWLRGADEKTIVPIPGDEATATYRLVMIHADDEAREVLLSCALASVTRRKRTAVALAIAELNSRFRAVTFSFVGDLVVADVHVELAFSSDSPAMVALGFRRLCVAVSESVGAVLRATRRNGRPRVEREVNQILARLGE